MREKHVVHVVFDGFVPSRLVVKRCQHTGGCNMQMIAQCGHRIGGRPAQNQVANGCVNQPNLEYLRNAAAIGLAQAAFQHHRENHRCGGANAVVSVPLQLAGCMQHCRQIGNHITLWQARAKQQRTRQRAVIHEQRFCALNLGVIGPRGKHLPLLQVLLQGGVDFGGQGVVSAVPVEQACILCPLLKLAVDQGNLCEVICDVVRCGLCIPVPQNALHRVVGQRVCGVLSLGQPRVRYRAGYQGVGILRPPAPPACQANQQRNPHGEKCNRAGFNRIALDHLEQHRKPVNSEGQQRRPFRKAGIRLQPPFANRQVEGKYDTQRDRHPTHKPLQRLAKPPAIGLGHDPGLQHKHHVRVCTQVIRCHQHGRHQ